VLKVVGGGILHPQDHNTEQALKGLTLLTRQRSFCLLLLLELNKKERMEENFKQPKKKERDAWPTRDKIVWENSTTLVESPSSSLAKS